MILILGTSSYEQGTDPVIDWLLAEKVEFMKITLEDIFQNFESIRIDINSKKVYYQNICLNERVKVVWYRYFFQKKKYVERNHPYENQLNHELNNEVEVFTNYLFETLKSAVWISDYDKIQVNKLKILDSAREAGLNIPSSRIFSKKEDVLQYLKSEGWGRLIAKQFSDKSRGYFQKDEKAYVSLATGFSEEEIQDFPPHFFPTLFQEKIQTHYEIRSFYIDGNFFSTAILSRGGYKVDDRKDLINSSEISNVVYALPQNIKVKLWNLMSRLKLKMGAIDLIKCISGKYYFLEVNPMGQYLYESNKCNFYLEKKIAEYLMSYSID